MTRGDLEVLEDWCYEAVFNILATPVRQAKQMGYMITSRVSFFRNCAFYIEVLTPLSPALLCDTVPKHMGFMSRSSSATLDSS